MSNPDGQLKRVLGPWMAVAVVIGTVIGTGVFKKAKPISEAIPEPGLALFAWVFVGGLTILGALALAEVAVVFPRAGGNYVFLKECYGPLFGFLWGWVEFWFVRGASTAALAWVFAESFAAIANELLAQSQLPLLGTPWLYAITIALIVALAALNARGTVLGGWTQLVITAVKVASLIAIAVLPCVLLGLGTAGASAPSVARLQPLWPDTFSLERLSQFGAAMVAIMWAYDGWMNIAPIAGEVTDPGRNLPRAVLGGVLALIVLYTSVNLSYYLTIPAAEIAKLPGERSTAAEFALRLLGNGGLMIASGCIMLSTFGALNGNILVGPRLLFAMGKDGFAPEALCRIHPRYGTPAVAVWTQAFFSILIVAAGSVIKSDDEPLFDTITDFSMFGATAFGTLAVSAVFVVRRRYPVAAVPLPYRCPLYPLTPTVYIGFMLAVLVNMFVQKTRIAETGAGLIAVGAVVYFAVFRNREVK